MHYSHYIILGVSVTALLFLVLLLKTNNIINSELFDTLGVGLVVGAITFSVIIKSKSKNRVSQQVE
jgi:hypothetical protein